MPLPKTYLRLTLSGCLLAIAGLTLVGCRDKPSSSAQNVRGTTSGPRRVVALGRLQPAGGVISISAIPGERIESYAMHVVEGGQVAAGSKLAVLSSYTLRSKQVEALEKKYDLAQKQQKYEKGGAQLQVYQATAAVAEATAKIAEINSQKNKLSGLGEAAAIATEDVQRLAQLQRQDPELVTPHELRRKENEAARARNEHRSLKDSLLAAETAATVALETAVASKALAESNVSQLTDIDQSEVVRLELEVAQQTVQQSELYAPGAENDPPLTILKKFVEPGEFITQLPVLQAADLSTMVCIAEVYEGDLTQIKECQEVVITSSAFDSKFASGIRGKVVHIGSMIGNPELTNRNPLAPSDRSVVEVRIEFDPKRDTEEEREKRLIAVTKEAAARVGLQVTVEFIPVDKKAQKSNQQAQGKSEAEVEEPADAPAESPLDVDTECEKITAK
ncbi:hypothetical protein [Adhaeretor mobilis]|uniref:Uncharacterized protein n=1 Tax=Adhaeretor mobilis TaxID=1930276 RepID=A0A517MT46_9BACT|nr:hypothetical protein [Adhaeretor mobilis]QDS98056.1 hypothetical protein HG15A2_13270 [Adhaeretor mobilis]